MAKAPRTILAKLPTYQNDRAKWRREIIGKVEEAALSAGVKFHPEDALEVVVLLYLSKGKRFGRNDVDNLIKDVFDALQGFVFDKGKGGLSRIVPNDSQICRLLVEKQTTPKRFARDAPDAGGRLLIRPYQKCGWPLQVTKGNRLVKRVAR